MREKREKPRKRDKTNNRNSGPWGHSGHAFRAAAVVVWLCAVREKLEQTIYKAVWLEGPRDQCNHHLPHAQQR